MSENMVLVDLKQPFRVRQPGGGEKTYYPRSTGTPMPESLVVGLGLKRHQGEAKAEGEGATSPQPDTTAPQQSGQGVEGGGTPPPPEPSPEVARILKMLENDAEGTTVSELKAHTDRLELFVQGTGAGGNEVKADYVKALTAWTASQQQPKG